MKKILFVFAFIVSVTSISSAQTVDHFSTSLNYGSTQKEEVLKLQQFLYSLGYLKIQPTGSYLTLTQKAVSEFQRANNVQPASGYFGPLTRKIANQLYSQNASSDSILPASVEIESITENSLQGSTIMAGSKTVKWKSTNYPKSAGVNINLLRKTSDSPISYEHVRVVATDTVNDGTETWLNQSVDTGNLYVEITCSSTYKFKSGCSFSSNPVEIK